jgi:L-2-aminoadipate reductase
MAPRESESMNDTEDPAYPSSRQKIYLSVSRPRALLVLRRAGKISQEVTEHISSTLDLRCQIPSLHIADDGTITGGSLSTGEKDCLDIGDDPNEEIVSMRGIDLGPDSTATLSFTSGSTGIPKGVLGRHYSLTHFFPWMAQKFGLRFVH